MALKATAPDGVKIYNLSSGKSLPEWLSDSKAKKRTKAGDQHVELLQDFGFPSACHRIRSTDDGECIVASGNYPPQVRLFDVGQLTSKVTRHFDAEISDFQILTQDYSKIAFLCGDRTIKFHARFGYYHTSKIPISGRAVEYAPFLAHLMIVGSDSDLHRLDLYEGRFLEPVATSLSSINACAISRVHGLVCCAGSDGRLSCLDPRQQSIVGCLEVGGSLSKTHTELTSVEFNRSGLQVGVGTSDGTVSLYDLRSQTPLVTKDHMYDAPIHSLHFLCSEHKAVTSGSNLIASADSFVVKIWDTTTGETYTNIEPGKSAAINHLHWWRDSGLFFVACDDAKIQSYYIPSLGTAPSWCSFLEGMTEELEEEIGHALYDDYKFVTHEQLHDVGLSHLLGTDLLKAYMHGFFVHNKIYIKAQLMQKPMENRRSVEQEERISSVKKVPTTTAKADEMQDARFQAVYDDPAFRIEKDIDPNKDDSVLVPKDTVELGRDSGDESMKPFGVRTAEQRQTKRKRQVMGPKQFQFIPKARPKQKQRKR